MQSESVLLSNESTFGLGHAADVDQPLLTVIVPVFNEAATIDELLRRVLCTPFTKQIIVVDDGSTDATHEKLGDWKDQITIDVLHHPQNLGKGRAIRTALPLARGQFTIIQDGDLETDPQDYQALLKPLLNGRADFVIGSRFLNPSANSSRSRSLFRLGVSILNIAVRALYRIRVTDEACCYKLLSTELFNTMDLQCERFEFCPEVVAKAARMGLRCEEVAIHYSPRDGQAGKKIRYRDGLVALHVLWKFRRWTSAALSTHAERSVEPHARVTCHANRGCANSQ